jgi:hypothetical protein
MAIAGFNAPNYIIMRLSQLSLSLLFIPIFIGCANHRQAKEKAALTYDSIWIATDYPFLPNYMVKDLCIKNDSLMMYAYNDQMHSIDIVNLTTKRTSKSIPMEKEGKNGIVSALNLVCITPTLLALRNSIGIVLLDIEQKKILKRYRFEDILQPKEGVTYITRIPGAIAATYTYFNYLDGSPLLHVPLYSLESRENRSIPYSIGLEINIQTDSIKLLPITYPIEVIEEAHSYGNLMMPKITHCIDKILFNFPHQSTIYCFDKQSKQIAVYQPQSIYTPNRSQPIATANEHIKSQEYVKSAFYHDYCALRFREVHYSPTSKRYFQVHHAERSELRQLNRDSFLTVMDENMNVIVECPLPKNFRENYVVYDNLLFFHIHRNDTDDIYLAKVDIGKIPS